MARKMKDSGIEWIGEIPEGWEVTKLKYLSTFPIEKNAPTDSPYIGLENIESWTGKYVSSDSQYDKSQALAFFENNILFGKLRPYLAKVFCASNDGCCSSEFCILNFSSSVNIRYFWNLLISPTFIDHVTKSTYGTKMPRANTDFIKNICVPVPPRIEQDRIALYLDASSAKIDSLISETRSSIEEYKKLKQAVITQAVTKGVRGEREMKDSGIEWVSYIPVDWNTIKLKYCTYIRARLGWRALKADEYVESGFPFLSAFNIVNNALHFTNLNYINQSRYDESPEIQLKVGDVLLVKDGAGIGKCAIVENMPIPSTVNGSIAVISSTSFITPKYLYYYFLSEIFQHHIDLLKDGMGVPHLFQSDLKEIKIAFPSKDEQKEIADHLDAKCAKIDKLIAKKEQLVKELESYKKSLIYEVVTGEREV